MFVGHYKSVLTSEEFYSKKRESLDFPTQVEFNGQRYLLKATYIASTQIQEDNIIDTAKRYGIKFNVEIE